MFETVAVKKFAENSPELYTAMNVYCENFLAERGVKGKKFAETSVSDMNKAINKMFAEEIVKGTGMTVDGVMGSYKKYANHTVVREFANSIRDILLDMVLPEVLTTGSLRYIADFRFADLGDSMSFELENNALFTVTKAGYRLKHADLQKLYKTTVTLVPENHQLTVGTDLYEILTGREFIAEQVMKAARSIELALLTDAFSAFETTMGNLTGNLAVTNYTEKGLIKLCEIVAAYNYGVKPVIMGTPVALKSVLPTNNNYRYLLDDNYVKLGSLQSFNGYDVIPIEQIPDAYNYANPYSLKLDDTKIYVVSPAAQKLVQIGLGDETMSNTDNMYENANLLQMSTLRKAWDVQVITNAVAGVVTNLQ